MCLNIEYRKTYKMERNYLKLIKKQLHAEKIECLRNTEHKAENQILTDLSKNKID